MSTTAETWIAIGLTVLGCYGVKLLGLSMPAQVLERPLVKRLAALVPIALLAALTALQTFGTGLRLTVDARTAGLLAAAFALLLRVPFLVVVATAVLVTAAVRAVSGT